MTRCPKGWEIFQMMTVADSTTFPSYLANMRQLAVEKMQEPDVVIFNRVTDRPPTRPPCTARCAW